MKQVIQSINEQIIKEGLMNKLLGFFKNIFKSQKNLIADGKPVSLDVDPDNIKGPEKPCKLSEVTDNKEEMKVINDKKIGFPVLSSILANPKKFLMYEDKEYDVQVQRFFYVDGKNTYEIGYLLYDTSVQVIDGYANVLAIDVLKNCANISIVDKFICKKLEDILSDNTGILYINTSPQVKAKLVKNGYSVSKENNNWLIKKI